MDRNANKDEGSTLFADIWRYRWIVLGIVVTFAALALAVGLTRPTIYAASSSLVIQDPRSSSLFGSLSGVTPTRYLADQVAFLQSGAVAQRAAEIVAAESPENEIDAFTFLTESRITGTPDSNFILITFRAPQAESAILGANSLADAYGDVRRSESVRNAASALAQLEEKILAIETDLQRIETRIDDLRTIGPIESDLGEQYENALERLNELYSIDASGELTEEERLELSDLTDQVIIIQRVTGFESASSELTALLQEQTEAIQRRSVLRIERDQIEIDTELQSQSISLFSPALEAEVGSSTPRLSLVIGLLLGALVGTAVAYLLAARSQAFAGRLEPEAVLRAPLLAEVPDFREEGLSSQLPVRDSPKSASAEAFRFAVAGIEMQAATRLAGDSPATEKTVKSLAVISGRVGDGKTTVAANLALAAAKRGSRVLVIDADFGDQQLAGHLSSSPGKHLGITEIVEKGAQLDVGGRADRSWPPACTLIFWAAVV